MDVYMGIEVTFEPKDQQLKNSDCMSGIGKYKRTCINFYQLLMVQGLALFNKYLIKSRG